METVAIFSTRIQVGREYQSQWHSFPGSLNSVCCQQCRKADVGVGDGLLSAKTFQLGVLCQEKVESWKMMECHQADQIFHSPGQAQALSQQNDMSKWKHIKERNDSPVWMEVASEWCSAQKVGWYRERDCCWVNVIACYPAVYWYHKAYSMYKDYNESAEHNNVWKMRRKHHREDDRWVKDDALQETSRKTGWDETWMWERWKVAGIRHFSCCFSSFLSPVNAIRGRRAKQDNESCQSKALKCLRLSRKN